MAALALSLTVVTAGAGASTWHATSAGDAVAAKKKHKCKKKKKGKKSATAAKKKHKKHKCKKKKKAPAPPVVTPPRGPAVRLELTWSTDAEIDAHAWSNGLHDGWSVPLDNYETGIPGTTFETSSTHEKITEVSPGSTLLGMTFGICYFPTGSDEGPTDITATTVFSDGVSHTEVLTAEYGEAFTSDMEEGGPPAPLDDWCPGPVM
ncbi:MAG TPA: hypothetical protein VGE91_10980 [Solirubrobacterales bacterium]